MSTVNVRDAVHELADQLSDDATWDDVAYSISVRQAIEKGMADVKAGRTISHEDLKKEWKVKLANKMD